jgi:hypothetical protein
MKRRLNKVPVVTWQAKPLAIIFVGYGLWGRACQLEEEDEEANSYLIALRANNILPPL